MNSKQMNQHSFFKNQRLNYLLTTLWDYKIFWIVSAVLGFVLVAAYAFLLRPESWTARQSFIVRDDLLGQAFKPGRFESQESLQSAQETILEVARRPLVVRSVLEKLGPSRSWAGENWITDQLIEETQDEINFNAPNGAEFGKTEVIVLTAKASSRTRTRQFIELLSEEIITQVNRVRALRLASMEKELQQEYSGAIASQREAIDRLTELDESLGPGLGAMSTFIDGQNLNSPAETEIGEIKAELRRKQAELLRSEGVLAALQLASESPGSLDLSSTVLKEQANLEKMRDDLVAFGNDLAIAKGRYRDRHAEVRTLENSIEIQRNEIRKELDSEIAGVRADIAMFNYQIKTMSGQIESLESRLMELSKHRTEYLSLTAQVKELTEAALRAKTTWGKTKSLAESARTVGLITPMDVAQVSSRPDGVGKKVLVLAGMFGGLMVGLGVVLLIAPEIDPGPSGEPGGTPIPVPPREPRGEPNRSRPGSAPLVPPTSNSTYAAPVTSGFNQVRGSSSTAPVANQLTPPAPVSPPQPQAPTARPTKMPAEAAPVAAAPIEQPFKVRPVDLLKSAEKEGSFIQAKPSPTKIPAAANPAPPATKNVEPEKAAPLHRDNPFLRAIAQPEPDEPTVDQQDSLAKPASDVVAEQPSVGSQPGKAKQRAVPLTIPMPASTPRTSDPTIQMNQLPAGPENGSEGGIPDQIRKLTESIMRFSSDKSAE